MKSCTECPARPKCTKLCKKMELYVNGNAPRHERLNKQTTEHIPQSNYNDALYELMIDKETRDIERLEAIRAITDMRRRVILASTLVGVTQDNLAIICHIDRTLISKIYHGFR